VTFRSKILYIWLTNLEHGINSGGTIP